MIYPSNFEDKIGFSRLREELMRLCATRAGSQKLQLEGFSTCVDDIERRLTLSEQMRMFLLMEGSIPTSDYVDMDEVLGKATVEGAYLTAEELGLLRRALTSVDKTMSYISAKGESGEYNALISLGGGVPSFVSVIQTIESIVDNFNNVKDSASVELLAIRRTIRDLESHLSKRLQHILSATKSAGYVEGDAQITLRDGRAVIPVLAGNKRKVGGLVHDESATGKTLYIEPSEVVEINNSLREAEYSARREIRRILTSFTESLRPNISDLKLGEEYLTAIDVIHAKARWSIENGCVKPIISREGRLQLLRARHPLLAQTLKSQHKDIVPLDIELCEEQRILVISGPNAGGKSVCLKTTGIIQYMFQCGFLVPASENSELPIFESIYIDIGDEQSIDNDLSTYSSHLLNMKSMLAGSSAQSLVLIDEFGSGTEPVIGGAIAEAILERLLKRGCYGVITTHYSNIKHYATQTEGIANGAMSFDVHSIRPLFELQMGRPGSSFAIEIARKIGLSEEIIGRAKQMAGSEHIDLERQLREITRDKRYWEQKRDKIRLAHKRVEELEQSYTERLSSIKAERHDILSRAKSEAKALIVDANRQIEGTIKSIREAQAEREFTRLARKEFDDFRAQVERVDSHKDERISREMERVARRQQKRTQREEPPKESLVVDIPKPKPVEVGSQVKISGQEMVGRVQSINGQRAQVAFGQILTTVNITSLEVVSRSEARRVSRMDAPRARISVDISSRKLNFKDSIDVRGERATEALERVQNFIDDAMMVGVGSVAILHGKGTGALKEEIRRYLRTLPDIAKISDAHADRGGSGITVVEFSFV